MATIRKRSGKLGTSYEVRFRNHDGQNRSQSFKSYNAARDFKRRAEFEVQTGAFVDSAQGKVTLREYYQSFRERQLWEPSTFENTDAAVAGCSFVDVPFAKLRRTHVETWIKAMTERLAPGTVHMRFRRVHTVIAGAVRDQHMRQNPMDGAPLPRLSREELHIPSPETVASILGASEPHYRALWAVCAFAGLRRGEAAALKVSDVRFLKRQLRVDRQVQHRRLKDGGGVNVKAPKHESNRTIHLPDALVDMLSVHVEDGTNGEWLFMGRDGDPPNPNAVDHRWRTTLKAAGVEQFGVHDLRHYFASGLIAAGADVVTVQRQLGHGNATVTLNTYSHLWPTAEEVTRTAAAELMDQTLGSCGKIVGKREGIAR